MLAFGCQQVITKTATMVKRPESPQSPDILPSVGLDTLLSLDGEIFPMENGYWTKFEVRKVTPGAHIPHGISYSLTLHDRYNTRIVGFDNAHGVKAKKRFGGRCLRWDHKHERQVVSPYEFESPEQLLEDFWKEVTSVLEGAKGK